MINVVITFEDLSTIKYEDLKTVDLKEGMLIVGNELDVTMYNLVGILKVETEAVPESFDNPFDDEEETDEE